MSYLPGNPADILTTGTITSIGNTVVLALQGYKSGAILVSGTWTGTLLYEISCDNQVTWSTSSVRGGSVTSAGGNTVFPSIYSTITANGTYKPNSTGGITHVRVRASTVITGTATIKIGATEAKHLFSFTSSEIVQNVVPSTSNNSTGTIAGAGQVIGDGETTLGVAGIQVNFIADQVCRIQIQQSMSSSPTVFFVSDEFTGLPNVGDSRTFQATASYFRVVVTNCTGTSTTYSLETALCPIVEAVPRALTPSGNFRVALEESEPTARDYIIRDQFFNSYLDEYEWYRTSGSGGAVTPSTSYVDIATSTNSASNSSLYSKQMVMPNIATRLESDFILYFDQPTSLTNNTRRWGMLTAAETDGACFELKDGVFYVTILANSVPTRVNINGFKPVDGLAHEYCIYLTNGSVRWNIDDLTVYAASGATYPSLSNRNFHLFMSNENNGVVANTAYLRVESTSLCDMAYGAMRIEGVDGTETSVSIDGYLRSKGFGSVLFTELFPDSTMDTTNKWTEAIVTGGSKSVAGTLLTLSVTTASGASITETAKQSVLTVTGQSMTRISMVVNLGTVFDANNVREWGTKTGTNGLFFRHTGTTTTAVALNAGVEQSVTLSSLTDGRIHFCEIIRTGLTDVWFYVDRQRVGAIHASSTAITASKYDTPYLANYNTGITANPISFIISAISAIEDASQSIGLIGVDPNGLKRNVIVNENGALRITDFGVTYPTSTEAGEAYALRAYRFSFEYNAASAGTEYPLILIRNPNGSGKKMWIEKIHSANVTTARGCLTRVYHTPTVTGNGTAQTPVSSYIGGGASAASVLINTVPTITGNGTKVEQTSSNNNEGVIELKYGLILAANNSMLITVTGSANNTVVSVTISWTETA